MREYPRFGPTGHLLVTACMKVDTGVLEAIDTGKNLRPDHAPKRFIARICAAIVDMAWSQSR